MSFALRAVAPSGEEGGRGRGGGTERLAIFGRWAGVGCFRGEVSYDQWHPQMADLGEFTMDYNHPEERMVLP